MAYDIAISDLGDLLFAGNRDLQGIGGEAQVEQRIKLRLRIHRGTWIYDEDKNLGSSLSELSLTSPEKAEPRVNAMVREALRPMEDTVVNNVYVGQTETDIWVMVEYTYTETLENLPSVPVIGQVQLEIPLGG